MGRQHSERFRQPRQIALHGLTVKIATFNINNINKRLDNLLAWLARNASRTLSACRNSGPSSGHFPQIAFETSAIARFGKASVPGTAWRSWRGVGTRC